jgi:hypothetical protein
MLNGGKILLISKMPSPDGSGILLQSAAEQKIQRTAGIASKKKLPKRRSFYL